MRVSVIVVRVSFIVVLCGILTSHCAGEKECPEVCTAQCCQQWVSHYGHCGKTESHQAGGIPCTDCPSVAAGCVPAPPVERLKSGNGTYRGLSKMLIHEPTKVITCYILKNGCSNLIHLMFAAANRTYTQWSDLAPPAALGLNASPWINTFPQKAISQAFGDPSFTRVSLMVPFLQIAKNGLLTLHGVIVLVVAHRLCIFATLPKGYSPDSWRSATLAV